jgi:hypothetical protein
MLSTHHSFAVFSAGGCFHEDCTVEVLKGEVELSGGGLDSHSAAELLHVHAGVHTPIRSLKKSDLVRAFDPVTEQRTWARVECVIQIRKGTTLGGEPFRLLDFSNGLRVTPQHPLLSSVGWTTPAHVAAMECSSSPLPLTCLSRPGSLDEHESVPSSLGTSYVNSVYTVLLSGPSRVLLVNSTPCMTLGHGYKLPMLPSGSTWHEFYAEPAVADRLKVRFEKQWEMGFIQIQQEELRQMK